MFEISATSGRPRVQVAVGDHLLGELVHDQQLLGKVARAHDARRGSRTTSFTVAASVEPITLPGCDARGHAPLGIERQARRRAATSYGSSACTSSRKSACPGWMSSTSSPLTARAARRWRAIVASVWRSRCMPSSPGADCASVAISSKAGSAGRPGRANSRRAPRASLRRPPSRRRLAEHARARGPAARRSRRRPGCAAGSRGPPRGSSAEPRPPTPPRPPPPPTTAEQPCTSSDQQDHADHERRARAGAGRSLLLLLPARGRRRVGVDAGCHRSSANPSACTNLRRSSAEAGI